MKDLFGKCGANCGHCPAYKENAKTDEERQRGADGWYKYLSFRTTPDKMYCDGCQTPDERNPVLVNPRCIIRKCAMNNGIANCGHCSRYPCEDLRARSYVNREWAEARLGGPIPEEGYLACIEPYEGLKHLDKIRALLKPEDIVDPKLPDVKPRILDFPDDLPFSEDETSAFRALHRLLATIKSISGDTHIRQAVLERRKHWIRKLLWVSGLFGELREEEGSPYLAVNSETFSAQKIPSWMDLEIVGEYPKILKEYGVHCEHVPLTKEKYGEKGWLRPSGHLRKKGWFLKMTFDEAACKVAALRALQTYAKKLDEKYGKKAFRYFSNVDMRILGKN